jgi:hypothetical protein
MTKNLIIMAGLMTALMSGTAFAACPADAPTAIGGGNAATNVIGTVGAANAPSFATDTCICGGMAQRTAVNGGAGAVVDPVANPRFIRNGFTVSCSSNSMVTMSDIDAARFAIAGASQRGNQAHVGTSASGSVAVEVRGGTDRSCAANNRCTVAELTGALTRAAGTMP